MITAPQFLIYWDQSHLLKPIAKPSELKKIIHISRRARKGITKTFRPRKRINSNQTAGVDPKGSSIKITKPHAIQGAHVIANPARNSLVLRREGCALNDSRRSGQWYNGH